MVLRQQSPVDSLAAHKCSRDDTTVATCVLADVAGLLTWQLC